MVLALLGKRYIYRYVKLDMKTGSVSTLECDVDEKVISQINTMLGLVMVCN
ncbi:hypothetical protein Bca4012_005425 [Brassica carinata]|uniref:BnaCnng48250D protein n=2 Tax=Brassica TaxID=3705 RepID=A0A078JGQ1_BRANA|nr:BnaCnng48250D [Brassica napus]VDC95041.1 unnamed protein product [Brassica oleracea]